MVSYKHNEWYYKLNLSVLGEDAVHILSFEGEENISRLFSYQLDLVSTEADLDPDDILNKGATFLIMRGDEEPLQIHGIISEFEQHGRTPDYVFYRAVLVPKLWRTLLTHQSVVFQEINIEDLVTKVLQDGGMSTNDFRFELSGSYPTMEYVVQYRETDFDFINRRLEHFGIFYYFDHSGDTDVVVFTDSNDSIPKIDQDEDIYYNADHAHMTEKEVISELNYRQSVVTGLVKLNDYNYRHPGNSLLVENQIDSEAPGVFYDYGDHYKDTGEGSMLAKVRNEEIVCQSKIFSGRSDCRLFRAGHSYKMGKHYRDDWNAEYILTKVISRGNQHSIFPYLPAPKDQVTYENLFVAIPPDHAYRPPRITPVPRIAGIMTARMESGNNDEYAFLDDQGRYKVKVPFDLGDNTDGEASRLIRMSQPYSGPDYGMHFPNHADTEMLWSCVNGDPDRIMGLGTIPNPHNPTPTTSANKAQSVIRTAGQHELHFDDTTGSENIFLHSTKDWTINVTNDKNQTVGNNESLSVGANKTISVGNNRDKTVGVDQTETIGSNKTINVGSNHTESIGANMSQTVALQKDETIGVSKSLMIGASYDVKVGGAMSETVGATKSETVVGSSGESVGGTKSLSAGSHVNVSAGKNYDCKAGEDYSVSVGKNMTFTVAEDFALNGGKKGVIEIADELMIKCGKASFTLKKNGDILINGKKIQIKGSGDVVIKGSKILQN